ncbi:SusD/RagB family nutrient-binding outer membrane lipoprotein [Filimonas lacunae]|uniref:SusD/RagB family nutrient-binding outer membrane lipoprotein n=1 Tax=Filimonas lacunae TaxID=477680 RepID=UPI0007D72ABF|nr:SusD/RagB family nutrient-binding outer membrane lipoprotein [Filimonas lacunae]BAV08793.1 hypothetical protein FLA_4840 [Filimonas lacunae]
MDDKYENPEKAFDGSLSGFLTAILNNDRVRPSYWNVRTFLLMQPAVYSQTAYYPFSSTMYQQNDSYSDQYWNNFYYANSNGSGPLSMYRAMQVLYNSMDSATKVTNRIYMEAARVVLYDQASQVVDMWGDMPFTEAGSLETSSTIVNAKFDSQVDLYKTFLDSLAVAASYFKTAASLSAFTRADILSSGSIDKWQRYANSIRLRLLMRMSNYDETTAQTAIMEMLNNSAAYPLVDGNNVANYSPGTSDILLKPLTNNINSLKDGLTELPSHYAPDYMLNTVMLPANDPRIPAMFDKYGVTIKDTFYPNATYQAMPISFNSSQQEANYGKYAIWDSATFLVNAYLPGIVITAPEVNFIKAEAYERWGSTASAKAAYDLAVKQSVSFYYYLNATNTSIAAVTKPSDAVIADFVDNGVAYTGSSANKLSEIWTQKWLHFGFLQSIQAWAEYRRTGYPQLTFPTATLAGYTTPPTRLVYTSTEKAYNAENYEVVQPKDLRTNKVFWDVN